MTNRPFSTNNPFRNVSQESFGAGGGNAGANGSNQQFRDWVARNQSQMSFSSDDDQEEEFKVPKNAHSVSSNGNRHHSNSSNSSFNTRP